MLKKSLKRRFFVYLGVPLVVAALVLITASILFAHEEIQEIYDTQLVQTTEVAASMLQRGIDEGDIRAMREYFKQTRYEYEEYVALRIWKGDKLLFATYRAGELPTRSFPIGFTSQHIKGHDYRVFVSENPETGLRVEALQDERARWDLVEKIVASILSPILIFLISLPMLLWAGLRLGLQPLNRISRQVARRSPTELEPIRDDHTPKEIVPLVSALNNLLQKLKYTIESERQFTNLAAHELRTPLAVIQTQLDAVIRDHDAQSQQQGLASLNQSVGRASQMIGQLLSLARLGSDNIPFERISPAAIAREVAATLSPLALKKNITLSFDADAHAWINGNVEVFELIIRNLIDNAIKYTPEGGSVAISVVQDNGHVHCRVQDSGVGIPPEYLLHVVERFYRLPGNRTIGSGLGLSIVQRGAEVLHGTVGFENRADQSGLIATLTFPNAS